MQTLPDASSFAISKCADKLRHFLVVSGMCDDKSKHMLHMCGTL